MALIPLVLIAVIVIFFAGVRIIRPTHRGLIERLGKYHAFSSPGFHWAIPVIDRMYQVNIAEQMVDAEPQEIITNDNLNARVDAQVYFKVKDDEQSVKHCQYDVNNYQWQIVNLARTTLRNIIGTLTLKSANSERGKINAELWNETLQKIADVCYNNKVLEAISGKFAAKSYEKESSAGGGGFSGGVSSDKVYYNAHGIAGGNPGHPNFCMQNC
jgi:regulator of protease activity HflC (stomatin/prohibitin superfamily)